MFSLVTDSVLLTLRLKTINYRVSNGKGAVGSYITDEIAKQVDWQKQAPFTSGLLAITLAATENT
jgi:hypothetical protein